MQQRFSDLSSQQDTFFYFPIVAHQSYNCFCVYILINILLLLLYFLCASALTDHLCQVSALHNHKALLTDTETYLQADAGGKAFSVQIVKNWACYSLHLL